MKRLAGLGLLALLVGCGEQYEIWIHDSKFGMEKEHGMLPYRSREACEQRVRELRRFDRQIEASIATKFGKDYEIHAVYSCVPAGTTPFDTTQQGKTSPPGAVSLEAVILAGVIGLAWKFW